MLHLITVAPGADLFSSMGHTALVFSGGGLDDPIAYDWGAFDANQPALLPRFLAGELKYFLHAQPLESLRFTVSAQDRLTMAQPMLATPTSVQALLARVEQQSSPEEREYTYHWAEQSCSTRARNALDQALDGALYTKLQRPAATTSRFEGFRHLQRWSVPAFAWRFIVSSRLDQPLTAWQTTMVPEHLMNEVKPFAGPACVLHQGSLGFAPHHTPSPFWWAIPGGLGSAAVLGASWRGASRVVGVLAVLYGLVLVGLGCTSLPLYAMSSLDGIGPTPNWLVAGPQSLVLVVAGIATFRDRLTATLRSAVALTAAVGLIALLLKPFLPAANGDILLALLPGLLASSLAIWRIESQN